MASKLTHGVVIIFMTLRNFNRCGLEELNKVLYDYRQAVIIIVITVNSIIIIQHNC